MDVIQNEADLDRQWRRLRLLAALADARATRAKARDGVRMRAARIGRVHELVAVPRQWAG